MNDSILINEINLRCSDHRRNSKFCITIGIKLKGKAYFTGISYFANGAIGGAISVTGGFTAGAAATTSLNIGTDIITGNIPKFNDGYDFAAYALGQVSNGAMIGSVGGLSKAIVDQARNIMGKASSSYRWAKVGGGDLVRADNGFVQGVETNSRVLIAEGEIASKGASSINKGVLEKFTQHAFARGRHADLGLSTETMASNAYNLVEQNLSQLATGNNTIRVTINGIEKTIMANVQGGAVRSINMYPGISTRITQGLTIDLGKIAW